MSVRNPMIRNTFNNIIANSYFVEQVDSDCNDCFWKFRLLFDQQNKTTKELVRQSERVANNEGMIKYELWATSLQAVYRMRGNPYQFGYKVSFLKR
jgi:hypothetical protein